MIRLWVLFFCLLQCSPLLAALAFDFSSLACQQFLDRLAPAFQQDVEALFPGLTPDQQVEMRNRATRYEWVRRQTDVSRRYANLFANVISNSRSRFQAVVEHSPPIGAELGQIAGIKERMSQSVRHHLKELVREMPSIEPEIRSLLGDVDSVDFDKLQVIGEAAITAYSLSELRRVFLKDLINHVGPERQLRLARPEEIRLSLEAAASQLTRFGENTLMSETQGGFSIPLVHAREQGQMMINDPRLPSYFREQLRSHLRFLDDLAVPPSLMFAVFVNGLQKIIRSNS